MVIKMIFLAAACFLFLWAGFDNGIHNQWEDLAAFGLALFSASFFPWPK